MVDRLKSSNHARIKLWPVAALRIYAGIFFTYNGFRKVVNDKFTDGMVIFLVLALVPAGRIAGLDDGLSDKFRFLH